MKDDDTTAPDPARPANFDTGSYASTVPVDDVEALRQLFAQVDCVLLDFDGPVCSVFAGYPADLVADEMRSALAAAGISLDELAQSTDDPLQVLASAARSSHQGQVLGEQLLAASEQRCITSAAATSGAAEFMKAALEPGMGVVIVSNNGEDAIHAYLDANGLANLVTDVVGRDRHDARLMKPSPHLLRKALAVGPYDPARTIMLGDSLTDIEAARAAGIPVIALANKPRKLGLFQSAAPDALITDMSLAAAAVAWV